MEPLIGGDPPLIGPYRLLARLGADGMGQVYLAVSPGGRTVALKVVRPDLADDPTFRTRFEREVAAARTVSGPFALPVLDGETDGPMPRLATAYIAGPACTTRSRSTARCRWTHCARCAPGSPRRWSRSTPPGWSTAI